MRATVLSFSGRDFQRHRIPALLQAGKTTKEKGQWIACHGDQGTPFYDLHVYCVSFSSSHPPASSFLDLLGTLKHKPSQASDLQIFKKKHVAMHLFFLSFSFSCQSLFQYSNLSSSLSSPIPFEWWISVGTGGRLLRVDGIPYDLKPTLLESAEYKRVATELREWRDCVC